MLYKFSSFNNNSVAAFENYSAWFSKPTKFNDPFEGMYIHDVKELGMDEFNDYCLKNKDNKQLIDILNLDIKIDELVYNPDNLDYKHSIIDYFKKAGETCLKQQRDAFFESGVCCFISDKESNPIENNLMWGHYADGLKGFVFSALAEPLEYFEGNGKPIKADVSYSDTPPKIDGLHAALDVIQYGLDMNNSDWLHKILRLINNKSKHWEYEQEVRFVDYLKGDTSRRFKKGVIKSLYLGAKMPSWQKIILSQLAKQHDINDIYVADLDLNTYKVKLLPYEN